MKTTITTLAFFLAFAVPHILMAHPEGHGTGHLDHGQECVRYEPKDAMPNFDEQPWEQIAVVGDFSFYRNTSRPELPVAAMKIYGVDPVEGARTRVSWQVGEEILTARIEVDEMICVRSVIADDGSRRDLTGAYATLLNRKALGSMPENARKVYQEILGKNVSNGVLMTALQTILKSGEKHTFSGRIRVLDTKDVAVFFYGGDAGGTVYPFEFQWVVEVRWKNGDEVTVWSRREVTAIDGTKIIIDPPLHQRPAFQPLASDSVF